MKNAKKDSEKTKKSKEKKQRVKPLEEIREIKKAKEEIEPDFFEEPTSQMHVSETRAPVLERIVQRQMPIENPVEIEQSRETREERRIDYSPVSNEPNYGFSRNTAEDKEKKYETNFVPPTLTRREMPSNAMRQDFLKPQGENWSNRINESQLNEIGFIDEERKLPFEEQKKYKRFKLR